jgi:hypothetical protein
MEGHLATQADRIATGRKYAQSAASEKLSEAPPLPRGGPEEGGDLGGGESPALGSRTQVLQALGMVRGHCAIKLEGKIEDGGKKALAHSCAVQVVVHGLGEEDIHLFALWELLWLQRATAPGA